MGVSAVNAQEVLSTISYNPSRAGDYSYLKVSDSATLKGGLETDDLYVGSNGAVAITSSQNKHYQIVNVAGGQNGVSIEMPSASFNIKDGVISGGKLKFSGNGVIILVLLLTKLQRQLIP